MIASIGGMNWARNMKDVIIPFIEKDYEDQIAFLENNRENPNVLWAEPGLNRPYGFSKECLIVYAKMKAWSLSAKGIRINTVSPGATATPMLGDFSRNSNLEPTEKNNLRAASPIGRAAVAEDQARAMVYINSVYAEYISGCDLVVDYGFSPGLVTGVASVSSVGALNR